MDNNQKREKPHAPQAPNAQPTEQPQNKQPQKVRTTFKGGFFVL
jgi:hypothetical protein